MMVLASVGASSIIASSTSVSFCGEIAGDLTATLFLVTEPMGLFVGVWMVGTGFDIFEVFVVWSTLKCAMDLMTLL